MDKSAKELNVSLLMKASVGIITAFGTSFVHADIEIAKNWLTQNNNNSQVANLLQTQQEVGLTLANLQATTNFGEITSNVDNEESSEGLSRLILLAKAKNEQLPAAWQKLILNQNDDGGFGHIEGWQSNPLDTAYVLIALNESGYLANLDAINQGQWQIRVAKALNYLASQQQADGSYKIAYLDDLYINSYVLSAYTPYLKQYGQFIPAVQKLVNYLQSKQVAASIWSTRANNTGLFIDALVAESLYPYQTSANVESFKTTFTNRVMALQNADGSWQQDAYVTAVVMRSLNNLSKAVSNPMTSSISLSVIDAETNIGLSDVVLASDNGAIKLSSDSSGTIVLRDAQAGSYQFTLSKVGYAPVSFTVTLRQGEQLNLGQIRLSRSALVTTGQIQGSVTDKLTKSPLVNALVTVVLVDDNGNKLPDIVPIQVQTNNQGRYQIILTKEQLDASKGRFGIHIAHHGYAAVAGNGTVQAGGVAMFSPTLTSLASFNASLLGKVVNSNGQALAGANILYQDKVVATTDSTGAFVVNNLPMGSGQWQVQLAGYQTANLSLVVDQSIAYNAGTITLPQQQLTDPNDPNSQPLPPSQGTLIVSPNDSRSQQPLTNFTVKFELLDTNNNVVQVQSFSPTEGQINQLTATLPTGQWRVTITHPSYQTISQIFTLADKSTQNFKPSMVMNPYTVIGTVVDSLSNQPIANAPIKVINSLTRAVLFTGQTNSNGQFSAPSNLTADDIEIEITPAQYLSTTRYVSRDYQTANTVDMGEIRLRPKSAENVLPDLFLSGIKADKVSTDQQSLAVSGELTVTIVNKGNADLLNRPIKSTAFIDGNHNNKLDVDEMILGKQYNDMALAQGQSAEIIIPVSGFLNFKDAPITVMVDSDGQVAEKDENNNIRSTIDGIEIKPKQGSLDIETVWHYEKTESSPQGNSNSSMNFTPPIALPLSDSNGDGKIGQGDIASIIYITQNGRLTALDGKSGNPLWATGNYGVNYYFPTVAAADINGDSIPEIVVGRTDGNIDILNANGQIIKTVSTPNYSNSNPVTIADVNQDGHADLVTHSGYYTFNSNKWVSFATRSSLSFYPVAVAKLLPNSPGNQVISGQDIFNYDGSFLFNLQGISYNDRYVSSSAIADLNDDKLPEIITSSGGYININNGQDGQLIRRFRMNCGSESPAPTVADFNGDGIPDIGVAGACSYDTFNADGSIIWSIKTQDTSSQVTGSTLFDFNNDGKKEVVYADEIRLMVLDAQTGAKIAEVPHTSATWIEYPIIVDADGDSHADIIFGSASYYGSYDGKQYNGIRMISGKNKDWANTRNIWNQFSYHVTNINDDLTVPTNELNSWEAHNTYRANLLLNQNATAAVDLTTSYLQIKDNGSASSQFTARIGNAGGKIAKAGTPVAFYQKDPTGQSKLLGVVRLPKDLAADEYVDLSLDYSPITGTLHDFGEIVVIANDAGAGIDSATGIPNPTDPTKPADSQGVIQEYSRANNIATLAVTGDFAGFSLAGSLDKTSYTANETVTITSMPTNLGSFDTNPSVKVSIIDSVGNVVATYPEQTVSLTSAVTGQVIGTNTTTVQNFWNTSQQRIGNYNAHIELLNNNKPVISIDKPFAIVADGVAAGQVDSQLATDKTQYNTTDLVQVQSGLINTASNAMATARDVTLFVKDADGQTIWAQSYNYAELSPNALKYQYFSVPLNNVKQGKYTVTSVTTAPDGSQTEKTLEKTFEVLSAAQTGINISGTIQSPTSVEVGSTVPLSWQVNNNNAQALASTPISINLYRADAATPFATIPVSNLTIDAKGKITGNYNWVTQGVDGEKITAVLVGQFGATQKSLALTDFTLTAPAIKVELPNAAKSDTLLVYYACEDGWANSLNKLGNQKFNIACFDERETTLRSYLDRIGVHYQLVRTPWDFRHEMQSGVYGQYWLLGDLQELSSPAYNELVELTNAGQNTLFDSGTHQWLNKYLNQVVGVKYNGRLLLDTGEINLNPYYLPTPTDPQIANSKLIATTSMQGRPFANNWAVILTPQNNNIQSFATFSVNQNPSQTGNQSNHPNQTYHALSTNKYGNGIPVTAAFDIVQSLDFARKSALPPYKDNANTAQLHWDSVLEQLLRARTIKARSEYVPNEPVKIPLNLINEANSERRIQVDVKLPTGSTWLGYDGGVNSTPSTDLEQHYQITLQPKQTLQDVLAVRLPATPGTQAIQITVNEVSANNQLRVVSQVEARFLVRDIAGRIALIKQTLSQWQGKGVEKVGIRNALAKVSLIENYLQSANYDYAVTEIGNLSQILAGMQSTTTQDAVALRYETDELLRALQIKWYLARQGKPPLP